MKTRHTALSAATAQAEGVLPAVCRDPWRLTLHLMPPVGWLNDPNGLCWFHGYYHVFFQYSPASPAGAEKLWGHYRSADLLHWDFLGSPILPDSNYDRDGVYSGSALIADNKMHLFYTGNVKQSGKHDYILSGREANTVHVVSEDGIRMGEKQLLMTNADYPADCSCHVRDPKVWREADGTCYMVQGARTKTDHGEVLLFSSTDLNHWMLQHTISTAQPFGYMWECPDLFSVDNRRFLSVSPQGVPRGETTFQNVYAAGYFPLATLSQSQVDADDFREWDFGFDFYAPQTFTDPNGRRILLAWMGLPDIEPEYQNPTCARGWQHAMTLPRELSVSASGALCQQPIGELNQLRGAKTTVADGTVQVVSAPFDLLLQPTTYTMQVTLGDEMTLSYADGIFSLSFTGVLGAGRGTRRAAIGVLRNLRLIVDTSAAEIYLNDGETVLTTRFYPADNALTLRVQGAAGVRYQLENMEFDYEKIIGDRRSAD